MRRLMFISLLFLLSGFAVYAQSTIEERLERLGGYPCADSEFTCITLTVPLDHFNPEDNRTLDVVFGVLPASGERKGMFVTATGGPGSSGLASADSYAGAMDEAILEHFDIVFFDQRGAYQSGNLQCPDATFQYYQTDVDTDTAEGEAAYIEAARTYAEDCVAEMGIDSDTLPFYGTNQAVEDLDRFRQKMGDEQLWLYGESYGTQYAQTYTAAHPENVAGLILDGTVDLTISGVDYYREQAQAFNNVLVDTLEACSADEICSADVEGGDALAVYDDLIEEMKTAPITFEFPLPAGISEKRELVAVDLENAASSFMYSEGSRHLFQRAIAAASQGDFVLLARTVYNAYGIDPETYDAPIDPTYSDALFYAVECNDYSYFNGSPEARAEAYMRAGDKIDSTVPRFSAIFYGDLPCVFWPGEPPSTRPAPLVAKNIPTLVLGSTGDPATPVQNGERVFKRLADGYLITTEGGAHVIYGRGNTCPDDIVTAFLVDDEMPAQREITCEGEIASSYWPVAKADAADYDNLLENLDGVYNDIYHMPDYYYWDTVTLTMIGCRFGGTLDFSPSDKGDQFRLSGCAFSEGFAMTGNGYTDYESRDFTLDVYVTGLADGFLTYTYSGADGSITVTGTYDGEDVDLEG